MAVAHLFASVLTAANAALPLVSGKLPVSPGWSPAATQGVITNCLLAVGGGGFLKVLSAHLLQLRKIAEDKAKRVDDRSDGYTDRLTNRVTELETDLAKVRSDHAREMSEERRSCDEKLDDMRNELREMQQKMDGFTRQLIAYQTSEARGAMHLPASMSRAIDKLDELTKDES